MREKLASVSDAFLAPSAFEIKYFFPPETQQGVSLQSEAHNYVVCGTDNVPNLLSEPAISDEGLFYWIQAEPPQFARRSVKVRGNPNEGLFRRVGDRFRFQWKDDIVQGGGSRFYSKGLLDSHPDLAEQSTLTAFEGGKVYYVGTARELPFRCGEQLLCGNGTCDDGEDELVCPPDEDCRKVCEADCGPAPDVQQFCLPCGSVCEKWRLGSPQLECPANDAGITCAFEGDVCKRTDTQCEVDCNPEDFVALNSLVSCVLEDGEVECSGWDQNPAMNIPQLNSPTQMVTGRQVCVLQGDAPLCWGPPLLNQEYEYSGPVERLLPGGDTLCAVVAGAIECVGPNDYGQSNIPETVGTVRSFSIAFQHGCLIDDEGLKCWGRDDSGQINIPDLQNPRAVTTGLDYTCAVDDAGVSCWGRNRDGATNVPSGIRNPTHIAAAATFTCAIHDGTKVRCWGKEAHSSIDPPELTAPTHLFGGYGKMCAVDQGQLVCWGDNRHGQRSVLRDRSLAKFCPDADTTCGGSSASSAASQASEEGITCTACGTQCLTEAQAAVSDCVPLPEGATERPICGPENGECVQIATFTCEACASSCVENRSDEQSPVCSALPGGDEVVCGYKDEKCTVLETVNDTKLVVVEPITETKWEPNLLHSLLWKAPIDEEATPKFGDAFTFEYSFDNKETWLNANKHQTAYRNLDEHYEMRIVWYEDAAQCIASQVAPCGSFSTGFPQMVIYYGHRDERSPLEFTKSYVPRQAFTVPEDATHVHFRITDPDDATLTDVTARIVLRDAPPPPQSSASSAKSETEPQGSLGIVMPQTVQFGENFGLRFTSKDVVSEAVASGDEVLRANGFFQLEFSADGGQTWKHERYYHYAHISRKADGSLFHSYLWDVDGNNASITQQAKIRISTLDQATAPAVFERTKEHPDFRKLVTAESNLFAVVGDPVCGNGVVEGDEECDEGAQNSNTAKDACRTDCAEAGCGDAVVDTDEQCDDGNTVDTDDCKNNCTLPPPPGGQCTDCASCNEGTNNCSRNKCLKLGPCRYSGIIWGACEPDPDQCKNAAGQCTDCKHCGAGLTNICDETECNNLGPCVFEDGIINSCKPNPLDCKEDDGNASSSASSKQSSSKDACEGKRGGMIDYDSKGLKRFSATTGKLYGFKEGEIYGEFDAVSNDMLRSIQETSLNTANHISKSGRFVYLLGRQDTITTLRRIDTNTLAKTKSTTIGRSLQPYELIDANDTTIYMATIHPKKELLSFNVDTRQGKVLRDFLEKSSQRIEYLVVDHTRKKGYLGLNYPLQLLKIDLVGMRVQKTITPPVMHTSGVKNLYVDEQGNKGYIAKILGDKLTVHRMNLETMTSEANASVTVPRIRYFGQFVYEGLLYVALEDRFVILDAQTLQQKGAITFGRQFDSMHTIDFDANAGIAYLAVSDSGIGSRTAKVDLGDPNCLKDPDFEPSVSVAITAPESIEQGDQLTLELTMENKVGRNLEDVTVSISNIQGITLAPGTNAACTHTPVAIPSGYVSCAKQLFLKDDKHTFVVKMNNTQKLISGRCPKDREFAVRVAGRDPQGNDYSDVATKKVRFDCSTKTGTSSKSSSSANNNNGGNPPPSGPALTITTPDKPVSWSLGGVHPLRWKLHNVPIETGDVGEVFDIEVSTDHGKLWFNTGQLGAQFVHPDHDAFEMHFQIAMEPSDCEKGSPPSYRAKCLAGNFPKLYFHTAVSKQRIETGGARGLPGNVNGIQFRITRASQKSLTDTSDRITFSPPVTQPDPPSTSSKSSSSKASQSNETGCWQGYTKPYANMSVLQLMTSDSKSLWVTTKRDGVRRMYETSDGKEWFTRIVVSDDEDDFGTDGPSVVADDYVYIPDKRSPIGPWDVTVYDRDTKQRQARKFAPVQNVRNNGTIYDTVSFNGKAYLVMLGSKTVSLVRIQYNPATEFVEPSRTGGYSFPYGSVKGAVRDGKIWIGGPYLNLDTRRNEDGPVYSSVDGATFTLEENPPSNLFAKEQILNGERWKKGGPGLLEYKDSGCTDAIDITLGDPDANPDVLLHNCPFHEDWKKMQTQIPLDTFDRFEIFNRNHVVVSDQRMIQVGDKLYAMNLRKGLHVYNERDNTWAHMNVINAANGEKYVNHMVEVNGKVYVQVAGSRMRNGNLAPFIHVYEAAGPSAFRPLAEFEGNGRILEHDGRLYLLADKAYYYNGNRFAPLHDYMPEVPNTEQAGTTYTLKDAISHGGSMYMLIAKRVPGNSGTFFKFFKHDGTTLTELERTGGAAGLNLDGFKKDRGQLYMYGYSQHFRWNGTKWEFVDYLTHLRDGIGILVYRARGSETFCRRITGPVQSSREIGEPQGVYEPVFP